MKGTICKKVNCEEWDFGCQIGQNCAGFEPLKIEIRVKPFKNALIEFKNFVIVPEEMYDAQILNHMNMAAELFKVKQQLSKLYAISE